MCKFRFSFGHFRFCVPNTGDNDVMYLTTYIKYKVERDERNLPYIELGRWLCSHFQLETPLNFHKPITRKLYNVE